MGKEASGDMKVLITGGAGFVGSNLACFLKREFRSWKVVSFDNLHRRGSELNLPRLKDAGVSFVHGDIRNKEDLQQVGNFDLLIECSAEPSVLAGYDESPEYLINTNLMGTINCLERCRLTKADVIFLSTSRVYPMDMINNLKYDEDETRFELASRQEIAGVSEYGFSEELSLSGIRSLYGGTKLCSEIMLQEYTAAYDIRGIINRCGVLTGPWQMGKIDQGFVALWVARHLWKGELAYIGYNGTGKQVRDILHIEDLYALLQRQIKSLDNYSGKIFNVGGGREVSVSLCELTEFCQEITGNKIAITSIPETRKADIPYYVSDCRYIQKEAGWSPSKNPRDIVSDIYEWLREYETILKPVFCK